MGALHYRIMCIFILRRVLLFRVIEYQAGIFAMFDVVDALITRRENEAEKDTLYVVYGLLQQVYRAVSAVLLRSIWQSIWAPRTRLLL